MSEHILKCYVSDFRWYVDKAIPRAAVQGKGPNTCHGPGTWIQVFQPLFYPEEFKLPGN